MRRRFGANPLTSGTWPMRRRSPAFWLALLLLLLALTNVVAEGYLSTLGRPGMDDRTGVTLAKILYDIRHLVTFPLPLVLVPVALIVAIVALFRARQLRRAPVQDLSLLGVLVGGMVLLILLPWAAQPVREQGFRRAAEGMQPLVLAIARYEHENGHPPPTLEQLAPGYVEDVERFGVRGCRRMEYRTRGTSGRWELRLQCPNGWILPHEHNQRFREWAYFWD